MRSGECPSRLLALHYGADLVWGPETVDKSLIGTTRRVNERTGTIDFTRFSNNTVGRDGADAQESVIYRLHPQREGKQHIFQIGSANPETAVAAAKVIAADVSGIDLNSGCPKPFSTSGGMGAALLRTPDKLCAILRALVDEVGTPHEIGISVKIRLLETPELTRALVERLVRTGITGLTIHCRTTPMRPRERAIREQLRMIGDICREAGVACLMNGDVASRDEAIRLAEEYGVDGGMIATAAEQNSSVFRPDSEGGKENWRLVTRKYVELAMEVENRWGNTKYLLAQLMPGKAPQYQMMTRAKSYSEAVSAMQWTNELGALADKTDQILEIGRFEKPKLSKAERKAANKLAAQQSKAVPDADQTQKAGQKRKAEEAGLYVSVPQLDDVRQLHHATSVTV